VGCAPPGSSAAGRSRPGHRRACLAGPACLCAGMTDEAVKRVDEALKIKEQEIMQV
jgi:hypothetical protein